MQHAAPRLPMQSFPDTPEEAREHLARLLRARPGIEEDLGCREGCSDRQLIESLLKHDSSFALLRSLGFDSGAASNASCLLKESALTPRVRDLARNIEVKLSPMQRPSSTRGTPVMRKSDMADVQDSAFDWRKEVLDARVAPPGERDAPPSSWASGFHLGQAVRVAFTEDGLRMAGYVTCVEPLRVQPQGISESFEFMHVEAVEADVDSAVQAVADECAPVDTDLKALDGAKLCLQMGMPQLAKVYLEKVSVIDVKSGTIPTPMMASIVEEEEGTAEKEERATRVPVQDPAEVDSHQPEFEPTALDSPAGIVNDEGAQAALGADGVRYCNGGALAAEGVGDRRGPEDPEAPLEPRFVVGQRVTFADHEAGEWNTGVVTCVDPLLIRPDGYEQSFDFNLVEPADCARPGVSAAECAGVQGGLPRSWCGGRAERLSAPGPPDTSLFSGASPRGTPRWHDMGTAIATCTSRAQGLPATQPLQNTSALGHAVLSSPKGDAMTKLTKHSWLPCCVSR